MIRKVATAFAGLLLVLLFVVVAAILWPSTAAPIAKGPRDYLLSNVRVVDVERGIASGLTSVRIQNGVIAAIGADAATSRAVRIEGGGGYLIPGFWDMHVHTFKLSPQMHLPLFLANGVTNLRDMMDCPGEQDTLLACVKDKRGWTSAVEAGSMASPRIVSVASYYLEDPELTASEVSKRVQQASVRGIDEVKVYNRLSRSGYAAAAAEARRSGLRLVGHLPKGVTLEEALAAGHRSFEHAHLLPRHCFGRAAEWRSGKLDDSNLTQLVEEIVRHHDPERCVKAFALLKEAQAWLVPTHVTREEDARAGDPGFINDQRLAYLDPLSRWAFKDDLAYTRSAYPGERGEQALRDYFEHGLRLTGAAHRAGVPILVGTDTAIGGFRYHDELELLVRSGIPASEVLRMATIKAARYAHLDRSFGSVSVGKQADLVLLDANPLSDIRNTRKIRAVVLAGRIYDRRALDELLSFTRSQAARPDNWIKLLWGFARSSMASDF